LFFILAILLILENSGYNVAGLLAGLGIGGLAVALAGKETLANLFGSLTVLIDRPFQVGDVIRLADVEGTVEKIGLRSTQVRTPDGFMVFVPNQNVTTLNVVNLSAREARRQVFVLGLIYDLTAEQMQQAIKLVKDVIVAHPQTEDVWVHWKDFGESSLNIQVTYWSKAMDPKGFLDAIDELNAGIKKAMDAAGFGFAFPTRTVVLQKSAD
jgi:MscS family membrane protein